MGQARARLRGKPPFNSRSLLLPSKNTGPQLQCLPAASGAARSSVPARTRAGIPICLGRHCPPTVRHASGEQECEMPQFFIQFFFFFNNLAQDSLCWPDAPAELQASQRTTSPFLTILVRQKIQNQPPALCLGNKFCHRYPVHAHYFQRPHITLLA